MLQRTLPVAPRSPPGEVQQRKMRGFLGCRPVGEAAPDPTEEHLCSSSATREQPKSFHAICFYPDFRIP